MVRPASKFVFIALLFAAPAPALAQDYEYADRSDFVSMSAGSASAANTAIQTPTPWPSYVNETHIHTPSRQGVSALDKMFRQYEAGGKSSPQTIINIGK